MQFDVGADQRRGEFGIGCCAGASAPDLRGNVVDFLAVLFVVTNCISWGVVLGREGLRIQVYLVCYYFAAGCSGICCNLVIVVSLGSHFQGKNIECSFLMETRPITYHDAIIIRAANNGCTGAGCFGERYALGVENMVAVVVGKVKTRHFECQIGAGRSV